MEHKILFPFTQEDEEEEGESRKPSSSHILGNEKSIYRD